MSASIEFNADKLIKKLDLIQKAYLPQAAEQALKSFGFESRKTLADEMRNRYGTATNYTLKSPRFVHKGLDLTIFINDDQSQNQGKYGTNRIPVPVPGSRAGRQFINKQGNLKGKKVQSLISQLTSPSASYREQYFVLTERHGGLGPGIWRKYRAKNAVSLAFALLDQKPTQDTSIDIHGLLLKEAEQRLPVLIQQKLDRLLR